MGSVAIGGKDIPSRAVSFHFPRSDAAPCHMVVALNGTLSSPTEGIRQTFLS